MNIAAAEETVALCTGEAFALPVDVADEAQVAAMMAATAERFGGIDVLYNNAGISPDDDASILDTSVEAWQRVQDVNTKGVFLCCKHGIPYLRERGGGSVINVASFVAILGAATSQISYTASKGAVLALSRELAVQFAREGIRVNALCPGPVETPLLLNIFGDDPAALERRRIHWPTGRLGEAARDRQRRALPGERRVVVRDRLDVPRRRRPHRRLRHAPSERPGARVVVIGGGVGGCSILYWLTRLGWRDVVLVERAELTSGSTFHSAGLVGQLRGSLSLTKMMMSSVELYRTLGEEVGLETGWREVGSLRLASSQERMEELARQSGWAKTFGLPLELISAEEAQRLFPPMTTDGVLGAAYLPTDGYIDPSQLTFALAEGARRGGAEIYQQHARHGDPGRARPRHRRRHRPRRDRGRGRGQRGRHVREGDRRARGRERPDRADGARVPDHEAVGPPDRHADDARPVAPRLLPARVGRPDHGRLRAATRRPGRSTASRPTSTASSSPRTGRGSRS